MIGRITGTLIEKTPLLICIDVGGVGYDILVPMSTLYELPAVGTKVTLYTHFAVREDAQVLYGFLNDKDRQTFRQLIKVSGIGPKIGLAILSGMSGDQIAQAISLDDVVSLTKIPGIGKKTAERLILELKGKLIATASPQTPEQSARHDILEALIALGYSEKEATQAVKSLDPNVDLNQGIRLALNALTHR